MKRMIGIDPGSRYTGYGIIDKENNSMHFVASGCIDVSKESSLKEKYAKIFFRLQEIIDSYQPQILSLEKIFYSKNVQSALVLGQTRGVIILIAHLKELDLYEYSAKEIKRAVTGNGNASKEQIIRMTEILLNLSQKQGSDASDALAAAICHANRFRFNYLQTIEKTTL